MHIKPKKRLGQNFLTDKNIQRKLVASYNLKTLDHILEIGAGYGELTKLIAPNVAFVYALEIDPELCKTLRDNTKGYSNIEIINQDILRFDLEKYFIRRFKNKKIAFPPLAGSAIGVIGDDFRRFSQWYGKGSYPEGIDLPKPLKEGSYPEGIDLPKPLKEGSYPEGIDPPIPLKEGSNTFLYHKINPAPARRGGIKVVGNIPYYITSPIIEYLLKYRDKIETVFISVQKEFAKRIVANAGSKEYGSFSCFVQYYSIPKILFFIKKGSFSPIPKVDSCLLELKIRQAPAVNAKDEELFFKVIRASFNKRRKTLRNSLDGIIPLQKLLEFFKKYHIDSNIRPEDLTLKDFAHLTNIIQENCLPAFGGIRHRRDRQ